MLTTRETNSNIENCIEVRQPRKPNPANVNVSVSALPPVPVLSSTAMLIDLE